MHVKFLLNTHVRTYTPPTQYPDFFESLKPFVSYLTWDTYIAFNINTYIRILINYICTSLYSACSILSLILWLSSASETTLTLFNAKQARTDGRTDGRDETRREREGDDARERARLRGSSRLTAAGGTYLSLPAR